MNQIEMASALRAFASLFAGFLIGFLRKPRENCEERGLKGLFLL